MKHVHGFVFVHGINFQGTAQELQDHMTKLLADNDLLRRFQHPDTCMNLVWTAHWRSLGDFMGDLEDLNRHTLRRQQAVTDIKRAIETSWAYLKLTCPADTIPHLLVCAHSMGQPLAVQALHELDASEEPYPMSTSLLSVGGPLGNQSPVVKRYLESGLDGTPWVRSLVTSKPESLTEWYDVWNPIDPVCCSPILGYHAYKGATSRMFKVKGQPPIISPFRVVASMSKYHSAYFDHRELYWLAESMLDHLEREE